jgi:hypothetical protein
VTGSTQAALDELREREAMTTAEREARRDAEWLGSHGYTVTLLVFRTALNNYGPESQRTAYAIGYAVQYSGTLVRDDGSRAEHPREGIRIYCQDTQLDLGNLLHHGRALVTFGDGTDRDYSAYVPYYVAGWNPRQTEVQQDQAINPGILPTVELHVLTPMTGGDGPKRFYDLRLDPAGDLATGTRVRAVSGNCAGLTGAIEFPSAQYPVIRVDPPEDNDPVETARRGYLRQVKRADLEVAELCPGTWCGPTASTPQSWRRTARTPPSRRPARPTSTRGTPRGRRWKPSWIRRRNPAPGKGRVRG